MFFSGELAAHRARGFADDEFRVHADGFRMTDIFRIRNSFQQSLRRDFAHSAQRERLGKSFNRNERRSARF